MSGFISAACLLQVFSRIAYSASKQSYLVWRFINIHYYIIYIIIIIYRISLKIEIILSNKRGVYIWYEAFIYTTYATRKTKILWECLKGTSSDFRGSMLTNFVFDFFLWLYPRQICDFFLRLSPLWLSLRSLVTQLGYENNGTGQNCTGKKWHLEKWHLEEMSLCKFGKNYTGKNWHLFIGIR